MGKAMATEKKIAKSPFAPLARVAFDVFAKAQFLCLNIKWKLSGIKKPTAEQAQQTAQKVTFMFKSFERQKQAKMLYKNIQKYYPNARVVIADDSKIPLKINAKKNPPTIIHMPFNSGLSKGLNLALAEIQTEYLMRMDDDELLTPLSNVYEELCFLEAHSDIDLVGFVPLTAGKCTPVQKIAKNYNQFDMKNAYKPLKVPHLTKIDENHIVYGKVPNIFLARTEKVREIGWDDNIRMIDHHEFFTRAAGNLVSVMNPNTAVFHIHNMFDNYYNKFRSDFSDDYYYIQGKMIAVKKAMKSNKNQQHK